MVPCKLVADAGRIVDQEVPRPARGVIRVGDLRRRGAGRAVVVAGEVMAVVGIAAVGQSASAPSMAAESAAVAVTTSVTEIDVVAAGGGADDKQGEGAEEASLHGR
jgi:hypothetical protein